MVCDDAKEAAIEQAASDAEAALAACPTAECKNLKSAVTQFENVMGKCVHVVPKSFKTTIKVTIPKVYQTRIQKEVRDVEISARALAQSPAVQSIIQDLQQFSQSPEAAQLKQAIESSQGSPADRILKKEVEEAVAILERNSRPLPDGFEINNGALPRIVKEIDDVKRAARVVASKPNDPVEQAVERALRQQNLRSAIAKLQRLASSPQGQHLQKEIQDVIAALQQGLQVTDVPANFQQTIAPLMN